VRFLGLWDREAEGGLDDGDDGALAGVWRLQTTSDPDAVTGTNSLFMAALLRHLERGSELRGRVAADPHVER
jgi:hypothetical protein